MSAFWCSSTRLARTAGVLACALVVLAFVGVAVAGAAQIEGVQGLGFTRYAKLEAKIDPAGLDTSCTAQYLTREAFEHDGWDGAVSVPCSPGDLGSGSAPVAVVAGPEGLSLNTVYVYRFAASDASGVTYSASETFTTFGIEQFSFQALGGPAEHEPLEQESFTQAGGHPYELALHLNVNENFDLEGSSFPDADLKDVRVALPPGLVGYPANVPSCPLITLEEYACPPDTQIGTSSIVLQGELERGQPTNTIKRPVFNVTPPTGVPARFGVIVALRAMALIDSNVRSGSDYGVISESHEITPLDEAMRITLNLWGVPGDPRHNPERLCPVRSGEIPGANRFAEENLGCAYEGPVKPFLRDPTSCSGALSTIGSIDSYQEPGEYVSVSDELGAMIGCGRVSFDPSIEARTTTGVGDSPTGLNVDIHVPQNEEPEGIATSDLRDASVTLPPGLVVNPSSADGLEACSEVQVGFKHEFAELDPVSEPGVKTPQFTSGAAECPNGSKLGIVTIHTPLLEHPIEGGMYLATPHQNPFGSLIALYLTVDDPISGVVIKLPGKVEANPTTGQLTAVFDQNPQLPFEDLEVNLFGGGEAADKARASLTTPLSCGSYQTTSLLEPWSHKGAEGEEGTPDATPSSEPFQITENCAGQESEAPNEPSFEAGTASPIAGSYSPFVLKLSREDGSQRFGALNVTLPPGLLGKVAGVEQCPQADIERAESRSHEGEGALEQSSPSCPSGSEVGVVHVGAGSGAPYYVTGKAYFAGSYEGAPFSLVIVTPAIAGPFDLGTVVVRAGLYINPSTAQVTVRSDPFPMILDGIPLDIRTIGVEINRREFTLNPTSCNVMSVTGEETSTASQTASLSSRFQAGGCANLPFHPSFTASTQGSTSKAGGASLTVKVNPLPGQANIAKVDLTLPKQLPARLTTLQKACTEAQFNANPAGCPEASDIGTAVARTPILSSPLQGPAYLVSHGGAAFPDVEFVLQGEGVEIVLDGGTQIKDGITYSKFETVPDAPISSFETVLPEGPHSVLGTDLPASAKYSLCAQKLQMPTTITGQNGVVVNQTTNIAVTGCKAVRTKPLTRAQKLAAALKKCRAKYKARKRRSKRVACEKAARKRFGPKIKEKAGRRAKRKK